MNTGRRKMLTSKMKKNGRNHGEIENKGKKEVIKSVIIDEP